MEMLKSNVNVYNIGNKIAVLENKLKQNQKWVS